MTGTVAPQDWNTGSPPTGTAAPPHRNIQPEQYLYYYGNPVQPVVPLDITPQSVFIIGAYPSARFATIQSERDVPVADNCGPFSTERYFDGQRIRTVNSGFELEESYLNPLGLKRSQCWITCSAPL
ncbi:MAG: hypothetical protein JW762_08565, partial [Dehalococcoidales bacterium]|nr:hypothetical protein [Dehalococcoidales bacterium]